MAATGTVVGRVRRRPVKLTLGRSHGVGPPSAIVDLSSTYKLDAAAPARSSGRAPGDSGAWDTSGAGLTVHSPAGARQHRPAPLDGAAVFTQRPRGGDMDTDMRRTMSFSAGGGRRDGSWPARARNVKRRQRPRASARSPVSRESLPMPRSASVGQLRLPGAGHAPLMHLPKRHLSERLASEISALNLNTDASAAVNPAMAMADHRPQQLTAVNRQYRPPPMLRVPDAEYMVTHTGAMRFGGSAGMPSTPRARARGRQPRNRPRHKAVERLIETEAGPKPRSISGHLMKEVAAFAHAPRNDPSPRAAAAAAATGLSGPRLSGAGSGSGAGASMWQPGQRATAVPRDAGDMDLSDDERGGSANDAGSGRAGSGADAAGASGGGGVFTAAAKHPTLLHFALAPSRLKAPQSPSPQRPRLRLGKKMSPTPPSPLSPRGRNMLRTATDGAGGGTAAGRAREAPVFTFPPFSTEAAPSAVGPPGTLRSQSVPPPSSRSASRSAGVRPQFESPWVSTRPHANHGGGQRPFAGDGSGTSKPSNPTSLGSFVFGGPSFSFGGTAAPSNSTSTTVGSATMVTTAPPCVAPQTAPSPRLANDVSHEWFFGPDPNQPEHAPPALSHPQPEPISPPAPAAVRGMALMRATLSSLSDDFDDDDISNAARRRHSASQRPAGGLRFDVDLAEAWSVAAAGHPRGGSTGSDVSDETGQSGSGGAVDSSGASSASSRAAPRTEVWATSLGFPASGSSPAALYGVPLGLEDDDDDMDL